MKKLLALIVLAAGLTVMPTLAADLTGTWNIDLDIAGMQFKPVVVLKHDGKDLTGTVKMGEETKPLKGTVDGEAVKFEYDTVYNGDTYHLVYTGKLDGDAAIKGEVDATAAQGVFVAKKAPKEEKPAQ